MSVATAWSNWNNSEHLATALLTCAIKVKPQWKRETPTRLSAIRTRAWHHKFEKDTDQLHVAWPINIARKGDMTTSRSIYMP